MTCWQQAYDARWNTCHCHCGQLHESFITGTTHWERYAKLLNQLYPGVLSSLSFWRAKCPLQPSCALWLHNIPSCVHPIINHVCHSVTSAYNRCTLSWALQSETVVHDSTKILERSQLQPISHNINMSSILHKVIFTEEQQTWPCPVPYMD